MLVVICKNSQQRCSVKEGVLRNFAKLPGKHLCQRLIFNKVAAQVKAFNFIKKESLAQVFSCEFCEISKIILFIGHLRWLLLKILLLLAIR